MHRISGVSNYQKRILYKRFSVIMCRGDHWSPAVCTLNARSFYYNRTNTIFLISFGNRWIPGGRWPPLHHPEKSSGYQMSIIYTRFSIKARRGDHWSPAVRTLIVRSFYYNRTNTIPYILRKLVDSGRPMAAPTRSECLIIFYNRANTIPYILRKSVDSGRPMAAPTSSREDFCF